MPAIVSAAALATVPSSADQTRYEALGLVVSETVTLLVAASELTAAGFTPMVGDPLVWAGIAYTVREISTLDPDGKGAPILFTLVAAR